jgi:histidinol phosphatase-like enzyme (inositol monophosphatase family)
MQDTIGALTGFAHQLADAAAEILQQSFRHHTTIAQLKGDASPVTVADRAVEQRLRAMIIETYPTHGIIGEEYAAHQPEASHQWILDPIDGTRAFACGIPTFGTLIGLMHEGQMQLGLMHQAFSGERVVGVLGQQSLWMHGGVVNTIHTSDCKALSHARLATTSPYLFDAEQREYFEAVRAATAIHSYGGDCYNYTMLAKGHLDIVVEAGLKPYDIAPLIPIIEGAGGCITDWEGAPLRLDATSLEVLATATPHLCEATIAMLA